MTDEMGLSPQMLQNMQSSQGQGHGGGGMPPQIPQMMPQGGMGGGGMGIDFSQLTPEQQMLMMQQVAQQQPPNQVHQVAESSHQPNNWEDDASSSDDSSDSSSSAEMDLDKLGLSGRSNGIFDKIFYYLKDPLVVLVLFILFSLIQFDNIFKPMLPYFLNSGLYFIVLKGLIASGLFFVIKLVI